MSRSWVGNSLDFAAVLLLISGFVALHPAARAERPSPRIQDEHTLAVDKKASLVQLRREPVPKSVNSSPPHKSPLSQSNFKAIDGKLHLVDTTGKVDTEYVGRRVLYKDGYKNEINGGREGYIVKKNPWTIEWDENVPVDMGTPQKGRPVKSADGEEVNLQKYHHWSLPAGEVAQIQDFDTTRGDLRLTYMGKDSPWLPMLHFVFDDKQDAKHSGKQVLDDPSDWNDIKLGANKHNQYGYFNQALDAQMKIYDPRRYREEGPAGDNGPQGIGADHRWYTKEANDSNKEVSKQLKSYVKDLHTLTQYTAGGYAWTGAQHMKGQHQIDKQLDQAKGFGKTFDEQGV